jgi:hypothetical protein
MTTPRPAPFESGVGGQLSTHYLLIVSIFKGVTLANAVVTFSQILGMEGHGTASPKWTALIFWSASFAAIILTYDAILVGTIVASWLPNGPDVVLPFIIAATEFMMFSVLQPVPGSSTNAQLMHLAWWPLAFSCFAAAASGILGNVQLHLTKQICNDEGSEESSIRRQYKRALRADQINAAVIGTLALIAFIVLHGSSSTFGADYIGRLRHWEWTVGVVAFIAMAAAIASQEHHRRSIAARVSRLTGQAP